MTCIFLKIGFKIGLVIDLRLVRGLHEVGTRSAQGLPKVGMRLAQGLHEVSTRSA